MDLLSRLLRLLELRLILLLARLCVWLLELWLELQDRLLELGQLELLWCLLWCLLWRLLWRELRAVGGHAARLETGPCSVGLII